MLHLETEWPSKRNILIADIILAEPGPEPGFKVWRAKCIFRGERFVLSYVTIFLSTTKFPGCTKKNWGKLPLKWPKLRPRT